MRIDLSEIWEFMELAPEPKGAEEGKFWVYELIAGDISISGLSTDDLLKMKQEEHYDTELLPSIFTFREILWQPNVYTQPTQCVPQLNVLRMFCGEYIQAQQSTEDKKWLYQNLLAGLEKYCQEAIDAIDQESQLESRVAGILGELRKKAFPIIKFFIFHPMNRKDYQTDALNRLNYAVKIMLTQYHNTYHDLQDPYWNVSVGESKLEAKAAVEVVASTEAVSDNLESSAAVTLVDPDARA